MKVNVKKIVVGGMLVALTVALSSFSVQIGAAKCYPVQHLVNVIAGIFLGPVYGVAMAFCSSLIRNLMGTGTLLAFPGSMVGAWLCGLLYQHTKRMGLAYVGEVVGTGILGGILCFPIATMLMGKEVALFFYVIPFLMSTVCGTVIAAILIKTLHKSGAFAHLNQLLTMRT